jgi:hypothetical protein
MTQHRSRARTRSSKTRPPRRLYWHSAPFSRTLPVGRGIARHWARLTGRPCKVACGFSVESRYELCLVVADLVGHSVFRETDPWWTLHKLPARSGVSRGARGMHPPWMRSFQPAFCPCRNCRGESSAGWRRRAASADMLQACVPGRWKCWPRHTHGGERGHHPAPAKQRGQRV